MRGYFTRTFRQNIEHFLENIDENRFATGSLDKTTKIWDSKCFVCLKTLAMGHQKKVSCIKSLPSNLIAIGSFNNIKIWSLESGECLQTLNGHSISISGLVYLSNGHLASCSWDETIKVWELGHWRMYKNDN